MSLDSLAVMTPERELKSPLLLFFYLNKDACLFHLMKLRLKPWYLTSLARGRLGG